MTNKVQSFAAILLLALLAWVGPSGMAFAEHRLALVVGIDRYQHLGGDAQLQRATSDADSIAERLRTLGFDVTKLSDATAVDQDTFLKRFNAWTRGIQPGDFALFYFAGHGVSINNVNYLVPADMPNLNDADEYLFRAHALNEMDIRDRIRARGAGVTLLMLDACRNNPFSSGDRSVAPTRGLTRIEPTKGVLTIYSAGYGQTALDRLSDVGDPSPNSVFTRVVLSELDKPGENLLDLSENVRNRVAELAQSVGHEQIPAVDNELLGGRQIYLTAPNPVAPPPPPADEVMWGYIKNTSDTTVLRNFVEAYPSSPYRGAAGTRLNNLEKPIVRPPAPPQTTPDDIAWNYLQATTDTDALNRFLTDYPKSQHATAAKGRLASLVVPPAPKIGEQTSPITVPKKDIEAEPTASAPDEAKLQPQSSSISGSVLDRRALIIATQDELKRLGCGAASAKGEWDAQSRQALLRFSQMKKLVLKVDDPTKSLLDQLRDETATTCKLEPRPVSRERKSVSVVQTRPAARQLAQGEGHHMSLRSIRQHRSTSSVSCFVFNGQSVCE